ncbi:hypothetical protein IV203_038300 [Nitzschia inconspicua]|uniref:Uncharacterized protein n=1 Tax=Nitzschia inconspicua TaxID=303405 RepID=A0A9K3PYX8_9STRA|nr:hypothetical protein IV203_038300 [Nitzschia inconspicua]
MATSMASVPNESKSPSTAISYSEGSKDTNNHAGAGKGSPAFGSTSKRFASPPMWKGNSEQTPSAVSATSIATTSSESDHNGRDYIRDLSVPSVFEKNEINKTLLECMRQGEKWQLDLERVHGFTEAESCGCFSRAGNFLYCDEFPEDAVNEKLVPHAKEGWVLLKETDRLGRNHPKELMDLDSLVAINGKCFGEF